MLLLCYPKCSTCQRAKAWLDSRGLAYTPRDSKTENPTAEELAHWHRLSALPLKCFFNTSGLVYKALNLSARLPAMSEAEQLSLLASDGMLVRRPILVDGDAVFVGFREDDWAGHFVK